MLLAGCAQNGMERRNLDQYFMASGITRYFLPDLPDWANYSQSANCHRKQSIRYFDMKKLRDSFSLSYTQSIHFQVMFNLEREEQLKLTSLDALPLKEEEKVFYTVSDKVQSGAFSVRLPTFKRVNLVWIDPLTKSEQGIKKLKELVSSDVMNVGHPVFVSLCMGQHELEHFMTSQNMHYLNIRKISYEFFTLYGIDKVMNSKLGLDFSEIFDETQKLYLYSPLKNVPIEFEGKYNVKNF